MTVTPTGLEEPDVFPKETRFCPEGAAESGAVYTKNVSFDPELQRINDAWPELPDAVKADIMVTDVRAAWERGEKS